MTFILGKFFLSTHAIYLLAIGWRAKYVPSDGLRGIIGKALLIKRFSIKNFHGKYEGNR